MKIVIDLQGVQAESRNRGIGRYSLSLAKAMVRHKREHEIIIALNGMFPQSLEPIRAAFAGVLPPENIRVWNAVGPTTPLAPENAWRNDVAELAREAFLLDLKPDFVHVSSPFEGFGDNAVFSLGRLPYPLRTAVTLYDLIPFMEKEVYLDPNPTFAGFYHKRIDYLRRADLFLAISESARREVIECLGVEEYKAVNISAAADDYFRPCKLSLDERRELHKVHGISKPFVLYSGATDERKNHLRLIRAFAAMPKPLRNKYQLVLAGSLPDEHRMAFRREAAKAGLGDTDLVITGRITDNALVGLYGTCELFVFPSWHEGFGLPALEAMCCGAAVIGSDTSSVPEVVGLAQARFDPFSESSISAKMAEVLTDPHALRSLRDYSTERAKDFSWDICARRTIDALEAALPERTVPRASEQPDYDQAVIPAMAKVLADVPSRKRARMEEAVLQSAAVARNRSMPRRQLLLDVSTLINGDARSGVQRVTRSLLKEILGNPPAEWDVHPVYATHDHPDYRYARGFHNAFLGRSSLPVQDDALVVYPEDVFFGLDLQHEMVIRNKAVFSQMRARGAKVFFLVHDLLPITMPAKFQEHLPRLHKDWLKVLSRCNGIVCVSRTVADELKVWLQDNAAPRLRPLALGWSHNGGDLEGSLPSTGLPADATSLLAKLSAAPSFLMVGTVEPRKGQAFVLEAMEKLWAQKKDINLVIVGKQGWNIAKVAAAIREHREINKRLFWFEDVSDEFLEKLYFACRALIAASEGEGFGLPLVEAAQHRLPIIARDIPVFREVAGSHAYYFDGASSQALSAAVVHWLELDALGKAPQSSGLPWVSWAQSSQALLEIILAGQWQDAWTPDTSSYGTDSDLTNLAARATRLLGWHSDQTNLKRLYVDVSELVWTDAGSGIQRVTRAILSQLFQMGAEGYVVTPVYATGHDDGYRYAADFTLSFNGLPELDLPDEPVVFRRGDIFLGLDLHLMIIPRQSTTLKRMQNAGVQIYFVVYDLLPLLKPEFFPAGTEAGYRRWLDSIVRADGVICISRAVADELDAWLTASGAGQFSTLNIGYFHLGSDINGSAPSLGRPGNADAVAAKLKTTKIFLTVSTIEPRKGHQQVLEAFEALWARGLTVSWVIVGQPGWNTQDLQERILTHTEFGKRLFWLRHVSDEYLEELYGLANCLVFASEGEGFGLPLAEAYRHGLPIIARDLPVFREIAGNYPLYFKGRQARSLAAAIVQWLESGPVAAASQPVVKALSLSWRESAEQLKSVIFGGNWYKQRKPSGHWILSPNDDRFILGTGERTENGVRSTGAEGHVFYGLYMPLERGQYCVTIAGSRSERNGKGSYVDVVARNGEVCLAKADLAASASNGPLAVLTFTLDSNVTDFEVRVWGKAGHMFEVSEIEMTRLQAAA